MKSGKSTDFKHIKTLVALFKHIKALKMTMCLLGHMLIKMIVFPKNLVLVLSAGLKLFFT